MDDLLRLLNDVDRSMDFPNRRPADAATLLILDRAEGAPWRVLMGRRHDRHKFMPGKYVFPGGRVDRADDRAPSLDGLHPEIETKLLFDIKRGLGSARARGLALAAIRETYEETGLILGSARDGLAGSRNPDWADFLRHGYIPQIEAMRFIARAITPPRRPRRFDTRFFAVRADQIGMTLPEGVGPSGELERLEWLTFEETHALDLPAITRVVIEEASRRLDSSAFEDPHAAVPYYFWQANRFNRRMIP